MANPFIGQITMFAGNFAPRNYAFCNGTLIQIASNPALFSLLGTTYGGDGRTTFALPDLSGRVSYQHGNGPGLSSYSIGQRTGVETTGLNVSQIPSHSHTQPDSTATGNLRASASGANTSDPGGNSLGLAAAYNADAPSVDMVAGSVQMDGVSNAPTENTGGGQTHDNRQPYLALNFIIALNGTFPSRS